MFGGNFWDDQSSEERKNESSEDESFYYSDLKQYNKSDPLISNPSSGYYQNGEWFEKVDYTDLEYPESEWELIHGYESEDSSQDKISEYPSELTKSKLFGDIKNPITSNIIDEYNTESSIKEMLERFKMQMESRLADIENKLNLLESKMTNISSLIYQ